SARAIATSETQARPKPPPMAPPSISMTTGCGAAWIFDRSRPNTRLRAAIALRSPEACMLSRKPLMSPPAQKLPPAPRMTMARTPRSGATASNTRSRSSTISVDSAFLASGRFSVTWSHGPSRRSSRWRTSGSALLGGTGTLLLAPDRQDAHGLGDDRQHDLVGAAADRAQARVAVHAADAGVPHVAHAAPVLQAGIRHLAGETARLQLCHRGELGD